MSEEPYYSHSLLLYYVLVSIPNFLVSVHFGLLSIAWFSDIESLFWPFFWLVSASLFLLCFERYAPWPPSCVGHIFREIYTDFLIPIFPHFYCHELKWWRRKYSKDIYKQFCSLLIKVTFDWINIELWNLFLFLILFLYCIASLEEKAEKNKRKFRKSNLLWIFHVK